MKKILLIVLFSVQMGNAQAVENFYNLKLKVDSSNVPTQFQHYFPKEMFPELNIKRTKTEDGFKMVTTIIEDTFNEDVSNWYSQHLYAMKEPLLFNGETKKEIYRFTWLRTFHNPIAIRIERINSQYYLYWKRLSGAGGYEPGNLIEEKSRELTKLEWQTFENHLEKVEFWKMPLGRSPLGFDGSEWILEGRTPTDYRAVTVWSPKRGNFYNLGNYLLFLTDLTVKEKY